MYLRYPSKLLEEAVNEFARLPGIGQKTALRLVLHLLKQDRQTVDVFGQVLLRLSRQARYCRECMSLCDDDLCSVCADPRRDHATVCVVENKKYVIVIEKTHLYNGV